MPSPPKSTDPCREPPPPATRVFSGTDATREHQTGIRPWLFGRPHEAGGNAPRSPASTGSVQLHRSLFAIALLTTGCEFWDEVTVPAADTTPPAAVARLLELDGEGMDRFAFQAGQQVSVVTNDPNRRFVAIGAAWDPQGAKRVRVDRGGSYTCVLPGGGVGSASFITIAPLHATQAGGPGVVVDTGVWNGALVTTDKDGLCDAPYVLESYTYWWSVEAENFFGQVVS